MPLPNLCEWTVLLTWLSLNTPKIQRNSDMTELSDKTIMVACLPAGFNGHRSAVRLFFRLPTQMLSFERQPCWGNYRNCDRGKILSLYEDPLGMVLFANRNLCVSLFDFLWSRPTCLLLQCGYCLRARVVPAFTFITVA